MKTKKLMLILFSPFFLVIDIFIKPILFNFFYRSKCEKKIMWLLVRGRIKIKNFIYDLTNEDELLVAFCLQASSIYWFNETERKEIVYAAVSFIKAKKYNRNLYLLFIVNNFKQVDELTQYALEILIEKEKNNSYLYYLATSYFYNQKKMEKSNSMLVEANNLQKFDFFESDLRVIINKVVLKKTKEQMLAGLIWFYISNWHLSTVIYIAEFIDKQEELNVAIVRTFGAKLLNNTTNIRCKKISIGFREKDLDKESLEYQIMKEEVNRLPEIKQYFEIKDLNNFNEYLSDMIKVGEVQALKNLDIKERKI